MLTVNLNTTPPWGSGSARKIIDALGGADSVMAVGGCVRDWLSDYPVKDIDFATKHFPKKCFQILKDKGFNVKPISIEHGTIAVFINNSAFEITSLRKDIFTDGRHASVKFGGDWTEDANRRDFTLNALYADEQGTIYDPLGKGFRDLEDHKLCFIGDPRKRIEEDYLRILRYFRFLSRFSENIDDKSLELCVLKAKNITRLSGERVFSELSKILSNKNAEYVFKVLQKHDLLKYLFTQQKIYNLYFKEKFLKSFFKYISKKHILKNKFMVFISFLFNDEVENISKEIIDSISERFHFSSSDKKILLRNLEWIKNKNKISSLDIKTIWLDYGREEIEDLKLILKILSFDKYEVLRCSLENKPPSFPCSGKDAKKAGFTEGNEIGVVLKIIRQWWLENDCTPSHEDCMAQLQKYFKAKKRKGEVT